tara:strand:+ start:17695 stop:18864 length:1170 start_codon:yes stop_codon:yes gene_type:complete
MKNPFGNSDRQTIRRAARIVRAVAEGDFEQRIIGVSSDPEVAEMEHAINLLIDRTDAYLRESQTCVEYVRQNKHYRLIPETGMVGSFKTAARAVNTTLWGIKQRHEDFLELAAELEKQLTEVVGNVSSTISSLRDAASAVEGTSNEANQQCLSVAAGAEQASANMQNVAASAEELTSSIGEINRQVVSSADMASDAVTKSTSMSTTIEGLSDVSRSIGDVVKLINDIAEQTNLLALNATIEAARAGEAGKGFAIVAQEVKQLAGQTATATHSISENIQELQATVTRAVEANVSISGVIENISHAFNAIAGAVTEQSAATGEIARNVGEAAQGTTEVSSGIAFVQSATVSTRETVTGVVQCSDNLFEQERNLESLRGNISGFLTTLRKVG